MATPRPPTSTLLPTTATPLPATSTPGTGALIQDSFTRSVSTGWGTRIWAGRGGFASRDPYAGAVETPYLWAAFVEGIKIALDHALQCQVTELLDEMLAQGATTTESSSDPAWPSVVELGNITNLVQLARHYPTATIYGFDTAINSSDERLLQRQLDESGYADRIVIMPENYPPYDGNLLNNTHPTSLVLARIDGIPSIKSLTRCPAKRPSRMRLTTTCPRR